MAPEQFRTSDKCSELRDSCRRAIFEKMDGNHKETMAAIGTINTHLAVQDVKMSDSAKALAAEIIAQEDARVEARIAVLLQKQVNKEQKEDAVKRFWDNPIVVGVITAVVVAALMGGLWAHFQPGPLPPVPVPIGGKP